MARLAAISRRAEELLGTAVVATTPLTGGDICTSTRLRLGDGRSAFVKARPQAPTDFFTTEADGLRWLADADGAPVPGVLAVAADCLILCWLEPCRPTTQAAERFGRALATTHAAGAATYGAPSDGYIGTAPLPNAPADRWPVFWAERRVTPYLRMARDRGALSDGDAAAIEVALSRIDELAGPPEPVSRIHGDLWCGNLLWSADATYLVDPAAHGGHRETDLAMLALFGAPELSRILAAYDEVAPLAAGWQQRVPLHQLHPLLVHAALFGGGYGARAGTAARAALHG
jgi:fructosamine-3-kinase